MDSRKPALVNQFIKDLKETISLLQYKAHCILNVLQFFFNFANRELNR